ncbi:ParA family protein [Peptostreptococcus faecalis]|uniref:ParA family protein n=1 Tax=Peptostreptococcus faecalis TaxID=2045015 RepID=UPI000C7BF65D|nr:AAA family ATPase [Peptostreptococcus faecalis]
MGKVISFANFKGGVGKTSTTALVGYNLSKMGKKVLMIDFDAQANLTSLLLKTKSKDEDIVTIGTSLMSAITNNINLGEIVLNIEDNLDLIPNAVDFSMYPRFLEKEFDDENKRVSFFNSLIVDLKKEYDYIFIDVPPTLSLLNDTAFFSCDQIVVVLQTQERSLAGAEIFIKYLQDTLIDIFHSGVDILGILPVLSKKGAKVDLVVLEEAKKEFGENNVFNNTISIMERVKRMDMTGITDDKKDIHDKRVHSAFSNVAKELLDRLEME